jgi:hypothetical protein
MISYSVSTLTHARTDAHKLNIKTTHDIMIKLSQTFHIEDK